MMMMITASAACVMGSTMVGGTCRRRPPVFVVVLVILGCSMVSKRRFEALQKTRCLKRSTEASVTCLSCGCCLRFCFFRSCCRYFCRLWGSTDGDLCRWLQRLSGLQAVIFDDEDESCSIPTVCVCCLFCCSSYATTQTST